VQDNSYQTVLDKVVGDAYALPASAKAAMCAELGVRTWVGGVGGFLVGFLSTELGAAAALPGLKHGSSTNGDRCWLRVHSLVSGLFCHLVLD
jgi:hypothetical protein